MCPLNSNRTADNSMAETSASTHELYREFRAVFNTETGTTSPRMAMIQIVLVIRVASVNDAIVL